jgi:hypothetical protein
MRYFAPKKTLFIALYVAPLVSNAGWLDDLLEREEGEPVFEIKAQYTPWLASWEQESTSASRFGANAVDVDYSIDSTLAHAVRIDMSLFDFGYTIENVKVPEDGDLGNKALNYLAMGINYTGITDVEFEYRLLQSSFEGYIDGNYNGRTGVGSFETDTNLHDFGVIFKPGLGFGYRYFDYEVPQDVYIIGPNNPNTPILQGFADMHYQAHYLTGIYRDNDVFDTAEDLSMGLDLNFRFGYGIMQPGGDFLDNTEKTLRDGNILSSDGELMQDGDTWFYDLDVKGFKQFDIAADVEGMFGLGYRISYLKAEFDAKGDYSMVADFETTFSGPYAHLEVNY